MKHHVQKELEAAFSICGNRKQQLLPQPAPEEGRLCLEGLFLVLFLMHTWLIHAGSVSLLISEGPPSRAVYLFAKASDTERSL